MTLGPVRVMGAGVVVVLFVKEVNIHTCSYKSYVARCDDYCVV